MTAITHTDLRQPGELLRRRLMRALVKDTDGFMATTNLHYTAKEHKSGEAR